MKNKGKKSVKKNNFSIEELLEKNNKTVLEFVDDIKNETEKQKLLKELIGTLEITLLDRDAGKIGPKLIDQLRERIKNKNVAIKEYKLEDLIWWKGTEAQLEYLITLLINENLIDITQFNERFALISKHFRNTKGNRFNNKQSSQAVRNLSGKKPSKSEKLKNIVATTSSK